jgi:hypothetical protein
VRIRVNSRERRFLVTDDGAAVARAGTPPGWRDRAREVVAEEDLNLSRAGAVFVPAVEGGLLVDGLVARVARASLAVYQELLELAG